MNKCKYEIMKQIDKYYAILGRCIPENHLLKAASTTF